MSGAGRVRELPPVKIPATLTECRDLPDIALLEGYLENGDDKALALYLERSDIAYWDCKDTLAEVIALIREQQG